MHDPERRRGIDDRDEALQRLAVTLNELGPEGAAMTVGEMDGFVTGLPGATGEKAGRDEPCGCGSERRYDRCCGVH